MIHYIKSHDGHHYIQQCGVISHLKESRSTGLVMANPWPGWMKEEMEGDKAEIVSTGTKEFWGKDKRGKGQ